MAPRVQRTPSTPPTTQARRQRADQVARHTIGTPRAGSEPPAAHQGPAVTAALIIVGAIIATGLVLGLATWLVGRAEDRAERKAAEEWHEPDPPPRHAAGTLGRPSYSRVPWT